MAHIGQDLSGVKNEDMEGSWRSLPEGDYPFFIFQSDYKKTSKGDGMCLHLRLKCVDPGHSKTELRDFLTLEHPNSDTVKIAKARLKSIAICVGHANPTHVENSEELHGTVLLAHVLQEEADNPKYGDSDGMQNRISYYKPANPAPNGQQQVQPPEEEPPPPTDEPPF